MEGYITVGPELIEYLRSHPPKGFKPLPIYSQDGDLLCLYWEDEPAYSDSINPCVTLERAFSDKRVVGVKITGVSELLRRLPCSTS